MHFDDVYSLHRLVLDWIRINPEKKAIVIASDIAKYELASTGEYTQGAGAVSMLLSSNPSIISFKNTVPANCLVVRPVLLLTSRAAIP